MISAINHQTHPFIYSRFPTVLTGFTLTWIRSETYFTLLFCKSNLCQVRSTYSSLTQPLHYRVTSLLLRGNGSLSHSIRYWNSSGPWAIRPHIISKDIYGMWKLHKHAYRLRWNIPPAWIFKQDLEQFNDLFRSFLSCNYYLCFKLEFRPTTISILLC